MQSMNSSVKNQITKQNGFLCARVLAKSIDQDRLVIRERQLDGVFTNKCGVEIHAFSLELSGYGFGLLYWLHATCSANNAVSDFDTENRRPHVDSVSGLVAKGGGCFFWSAPEEIDSGLFFHATIVNTFTNDGETLFTPSKLGFEL